MDFFLKQVKLVATTTNSWRSLNFNALSFYTGKDYEEYYKCYIEIEDNYQKTFSGQVNPVPTVRYS